MKVMLNNSEIIAVNKLLLWRRVRRQLVRCLCLFSILGWTFWWLFNFNPFDGQADDGGSGGSSSGGGRGGITLQQ